MKSDYEAVVVGAGPAGCSAAIHLKKLGVDVLLLDKAVFPRDKICGDGIPLKCFPLLEELGIKKQLLLEKGYPIRQLNIHTPNGEVISYGNFEDDFSPKSVCMARKDFDFLLLNRAKECLSQVALGTEVIQIDENSQKTHILLVKEGETGHQKEISARMIIGADGSHSIISRQSKIISPRASDRFLGIRAYYDNGFFEPMVNIIYDKSTLPGYVWIFPISRKRANIGMVLGLDNKKRTGLNPVSIFKEIVSRHPIFKGLEKKGALFDRVKAFPLNLGTAKGLRVKDGIILTGDAASFINPLTGGGIFNAMLSGKHAALVTADCLRKNDISERALGIYEKTWRKALAPSFFYSSLMKRCLQREKTAIWWLHRCANNRIYADLFMSVYGNPLPRLGPLNHQFFLKILNKRLF